MKRLIIVLLILLCPVVCFAQNGLINENQIAPVTVNVAAGESLTSGKVVSLINESGTIKAYNSPALINTSPNGSEYVFNAGTTSYCSAVALDTTRFIVVFQGAGSAPEAIVGTVSGSSISWGTKKTGIDSGTLATYLPVCKIGTDKVLIAYGDGVGSKGRMCVLTISGTTITAGTPVNFLATANATYESLTTLDTDKALLVYRAASDTKGKAKIITISGTTPTPYPDANTEGTDYNAGATAYNSVSALSSTSAIVAYQDGGNSNYGTAQVLSISGTTITPGTEYVFLSALNAFNTVCRLSSDSFFVAYSNANTAGTAIVGTVNAGAITYGSASNFIGSRVGLCSAAPISSTKVIIIFQNIGDSNYGKSIIGSISGTSLSWGTANSFNAAATDYPSVRYLGNQKTVISFTDAGNSSYGTSVVNTWGTPTYYSVRGISQGSYSAGQTASVMLKGIDSNQSGLISGSEYYLQSDFTIGTTPVGLLNTISTATSHTREVLIGRAKSATELRLDINYK